MIFFNFMYQNNKFKYINLSLLVLFSIIFLLFLTNYTYAKTPNTIKKVKSGEFVIAPNQTRQAVENYAITKLSIDASREVGVALYSSTTVVNNKITEDLINEKTANIASTKILKSNVINKNNESYLVIEIEIVINANDLKQFIDTMLNNNELKKEIAKLNKEIKKLEKELNKKGNKDYDKYNKKYEKLLKEYDETFNKINQDIRQVQIKLKEREQQIAKQNLKTVEELSILRKKAQEEEYQAQLKIEQESNESLKRDLLFEQQLLEYRNKSLIREQELYLNTFNNIDNITLEATKRREQFAEIHAKYKDLNIKNKKDLKYFYDEQIKIVSESKFIKAKPIKDDWETSNNFKARKLQYQLDKTNFEKHKELKIKLLKKEYEDKLIKNDMEINNEMIESLKPIYDRFKKYKTEYYVSYNEPYLVLDFYGKDVDDMAMPFKVLYKSRKYNFKYKFDSVEDFKIMYSSKHSFKIFALYSVVPKGKQVSKVLRGFKLHHLGRDKEKVFFVNNKVKEFPEIQEYHKLLTIAHKNEPENKYKNNKDNTEKGDSKYESKKESSISKKDIVKTYHVISTSHLYDFFKTGGYIGDLEYKYYVEMGGVFSIFFNLGANIIAGITPKIDKNNKPKSKSSSTSSSSSELNIDGVGLLAGIGAKLDFMSPYSTSGFYIFGEANFNPAITSTSELSPINFYAKAGIGYGAKYVPTQLAIELFFGALIGKTTTPGIGLTFKL